MDCKGREGNIGEWLSVCYHNYGNGVMLVYIYIKTHFMYVQFIQCQLYCNYFVFFQRFIYYLFILFIFGCFWSQLRYMGSLLRHAGSFIAARGLFVVVHGLLSSCGVLLQLLCKPEEQIERERGREKQTEKETERETERGKPKIPCIMGDCRRVGAHCISACFSFPLFIVFSRLSFQVCDLKHLLGGNVHICFGFPSAAPFTEQCFLNTFVDFQISSPNMFLHLLCWAALVSPHSLHPPSILSEKLD